MKRLAVCLCGLAAAFALAACSNDSSTTPTPTATTSVPASTTHNAPQPGPTQPPQPAPTTHHTTPGAEYCAKNQDSSCPPGSYIGPNAIPSPNGDGTWVPCEGTICTNPNHGANTETNPPAPAPTTTVPPNNDGPVAGAACGDDGRGRWVHLEGGNAEHYGTEWLCSYN
ncbi:hypothetical protein [Nocardia thraciensis]